MQCPSCKAVILDADMPCSECGLQAPAAVGCPACEIDNPLTARFCRQCHRSLATHHCGALDWYLGPVPRSVGNGRYEIGRLIGVGSQRAVFRAVDTREDRETAIGLVPRDDVDAQAKRRLERQLAVAQRLGSHPNIAQVYEAGEEGGFLWIASEYVPAGHVLRRLRQYPERRLPVSEVLRAGDDVARALAHAHALGVVHRDLGPTNVLCTHDGRVKLSDFGLAFVISQSRITTAGQAIGPVAYMSPEQILSPATEFVPDARCDLYSLGVLLYELATGQLPFVGESLADLIANIVSCPPVPPTRVCRQIPPPLESCILQLLRKVPEQRPATANTVRAFLSQADHTHVRVDMEAPLRLRASAAPSPVLPFAGRVEELAMLKRHADEALSGRGSAVILGGVPGIGTSRLAEEVLQYGHLRGMRVLTVQPEAVATSTRPLALWTRLHRHLAPDPPAEALSSEPTLSAMLESVEYFTRNRAVLILIEDLHQADAESLRLLAPLVQECLSRRCLLLGTFRDVGAVGRSAKRLAVEMQRIPGCRHLHLGAFGEPDVRSAVALYQEYERPYAPQSSLLSTAALSGGHPTFLIALLHDAATMTRTVANQDGSRLMHGMPDWWPLAEVEPLIREWTGYLTASSGAVLTCASVVGERVSSNTLRVLLDADSVELTHDLEELLHAGFLYENREHVSEYVFTSTLLRVAIYQGVPGRTRRDWHAKSAQLLQSQQPSPSARDFSTIAYHYAHSACDGGDVAAGITALSSSASRATAERMFDLARAQLEDALTLHALDAAPRRSVQLELQTRLAQVYRALGDGQRARAMFAGIAQAGMKALPPAEFARLALRCGVAEQDEFGLVEEAATEILGAALSALPDSEHGLRVQLTELLSQSVAVGTSA